VTAIFVDAEFGEEMAAMIEQNLAHAAPIDADAIQDKPFWWHLGVNLSRLAAPVL
jgi:cardiolipin synthase